jgi:outer membrane protein assembly factor BamB
VDTTAHPPLPLRPDVDPLTLSAQVRFRKKRVAPLKRYGSFRRTGTLRMDADGIQVDGMHVLPAGVRIGLAIVIFLSIFFLTHGYLIVGAIPLYFLVEYGVLRHEIIHISWSEVRALGSDPSKELVAFDFVGSKSVTPVTFSTIDHAQIVSFVERHADSLTAVGTAEGSAKGTPAVVYVVLGVILFALVAISTFLGARSRAEQKDAARRSAEPSLGPSAAQASPPPPFVTGGPDATDYQSNGAHDGNARNADVELPLSKSWTRSWASNISYPLIAHGKVFVAVMASSDSGKRIYALDAATGETVWSHGEVGTDDFLGIAYDRGTLFVLNSDGHVKAYDAVTGSLRWSVTMPLQSRFNTLPTAWGGRLYIGGTVSGGGTLYTVDGSNGDILWSQTVVNADHIAPTLFGTDVVVGYACDQARAFAAGLGSLEWDHASICQVGEGSTAAFFDGRIYVRDGFQGHGVIIDASSGKDVGTFASSTIPAFNGTTGYFLESGTLQARDLSTMDARWSFSADRTLVSAPLVVGDQIYVASSNGALYQLSPEGEVVASFHLGAPAVGPDEQNVPMLPGMNAGDGILAVSASNRLVVFG